jgi:hypothetical protein
MAMTIDSSYNPVNVSRIISDLYNMEMHSNINEVVYNFFENSKQLYFNNYNDFIKNATIVLNSIFYLNDQKLCVNIVENITDVKLKYKILEFFSYKWLEYMVDKNTEWTTDHINFINYFFQQLNAVDVIRIIKMFSFDYKEDFICSIFKSTFEINPSKMFIETIKQSYKYLSQDIFKMFPNIINNSEEMFLELLSVEGSVFNKSITFFCDTIKHFLQTNTFINFKNICNCKNNQISLDIIKWYTQDNKNKALCHAIITYAISVDNTHIFNEILKHFQHLNKFRILNIIIDAISNNNSIILYNYLLENIFYNNEIDIIFHYAKTHNLKYILQILYTHYSYKICYMNDEYDMKDVDVIYKSVNMHILKHMQISYIQNYTDCVICYNTCCRIIQLECHESHIFCENCLNRWMINNNSCPMCRQNININNAKLLFVSN